MCRLHTGVYEVTISFCWPSQLTTLKAEGGLKDFLNLLMCLYSYGSDP